MSNVINLKNFRQKKLYVSNGRISTHPYAKPGETEQEFKKRLDEIQRFIDQLKKGRDNGVL